MAGIKLWPFGCSEHEQFEQLIRPHIHQLYKLAYRFTQDRDDAEDLVQDVLLKLFPKLHEMQQVEKLSPWLARVMYRHFVDQYRSKQRSPIQHTNDEQALYDSYLDSKQEPLAPLEILENRYTQASLQQALNMLNEDQRMLVILHDVEGYTLNEIHQIQTVSIGTLKSRLSRARGKLRNILYHTEPFSDNKRVKR